MTQPNFVSAKIVVIYSNLNNSNSFNFTFINRKVLNKSYVKKTAELVGLFLWNLKTKLLFMERKCCASCKKILVVWILNPKHFPGKKKIMAEKSHKKESTPPPLLLCPPSGGLTLTPAQGSSLFMPVPQSDASVIPSGENQGSFDLVLLIWYVLTRKQLQQPDPDVFLEDKCSQSLFAWLANLDPPRSLLFICQKQACVSTMVCDRTWGSLRPQVNESFFSLVSQSLFSLETERSLQVPLSAI